LRRDILRDRRDARTLVDDAPREIVLTPLQVRNHQIVAFVRGHDRANTFSQAEQSGNAPSPRSYGRATFRAGDRATGQARGFAFVEMSDVEGTRRAISELDRCQFGGRNLTVDEAKPLAPRGNGGGVGGRQRRESRW
jgi:hypothetical protein